MNKWHRSWQVAATLAIAGWLGTLGPHAEHLDRQLSESTLRRDLDQIVADAYRADGPGAVVIVTRNGGVLLRKGYGLANVELQVPMQPEMVMPLASLTKQFTAAGILALAEAGKLAVDDDISKFLPAFPAHGAHITLEHLLTHTSGISALADFGDLRAVTKEDGRVVDVMAEWYKDQPADAAPGERWAYLNWGYNLLAAVIEQVSGQTFGDFLDQRFFKPLEMTATSYGDRRRIIPFRAPGYDVQDGSAFNVLPSRTRSFHPSGAGGLISTVDDLATWDRALAEGRVISRASMERMFRPFRLTDGTSTGYGFGWNIGQYDGHTVHEHSGGISGYLTYAVRLPDNQVYVAMLSNAFSFVVPPQTTAHRLAARAIGRPIEEITPLPLAPTALGDYVGSFRSTTNTTYMVTGDGDRLFLQLPGMERMALSMAGPEQFRSPSVTWRLAFQRDAAGQVQRVHVTDWTLNETAERVAAPKVEPRVAVPVSAPLLAGYAGEYKLLTGIIEKVSVDGDHLVVTPTGEKPTPLLAASDTDFFASDSSLAISFVRDPTGVVTGLFRSVGGQRLPARRLR